MIDDKSVLAIIPARGGSKGIPKKNIKPLGGLPLIGWSIRAARQSRYIDRLMLSSEDAEIIAIAKALGCEVPFIRPTELAEDDTPGILPVIHAMVALPQKYAMVVLLQPTSPFRIAEDIDHSIEIAAHNQLCVSISKPDKSPLWSYTLNSRRKLVPLVEHSSLSTRQQMPDIFMLNGAVYAGLSEKVMEYNTFLNERTSGYIMPKIRSVDIDDPMDFLFAEMLIEKGFIPSMR